MRRCLIALFFLCGCSKSETARQHDNVPLDKVPAVAMDAATKAAKEKFPDLKFESAGKNPPACLRSSVKRKPARHMTWK